MPLVNEIKSYSRCSYRLKEIIPLVNGVKFYCIYSQRLSQITVVVSGVKSFFMFHHYSEDFILCMHSLLLFSFR